MIINQSVNKNIYLVIFLSIIAFSLFLNIYNNHFPLGYHPDEPRKVLGIKTGIYNFTHPVLLREIARNTNRLLHLQDDQKIVILGRTFSAIFGTLIVVLIFFMARRLANAKLACITAFAIAISPIMVIHAHYLKEDTIFTFFSLLSLLTLFNYIQRPTKLSILFLGVATGLALSSHYKGFLLLPFLLCVPLVVPHTHKAQFYKHISICFLISFVTFSVIHYSVLFQFDKFILHFNRQSHHILEGHKKLRIGPLSYFFCFHLLYSLIPGITLLLAVFGLYYLGYTLLKWRKTLWQERLLTLYILLFYLSVEISPLKPPPDFMRYVIPIVPIVIYFAYRGIFHISTLVKRSLISKIFSASIISLTLLIPLQATLRLNYYLNKDTRAKTETWIKASGEKAIFENYSSVLSERAAKKSKLASSSFYQYAGCLAELDLATIKNQKVRYLASSSFMYDRYFLGNKLKNQHKRIYKYYREYQSLFSYPFIEVKPAYKSFAFSNPTIRIIDINPETVKD